MTRFAPVFLVSLLACSGSMAATPGGHSGHNEKQGAASASMTDGEVRRLDKVTGKVTLKHGAIKNLDMPPMTMEFQVKDRALLDKVKVGDKVKFSVEHIAGSYVVTDIGAAK